jgi:hypothetical protein
MRGAPHNGFASLMSRIKWRISAATVGLPGRRRDLRVQYHANASAVPSDHRIGANDVQTTAPTRPPSREQDPQQPVGAPEAQTRWRVLLENGELVTKREDLRLQ